jgi:predicted TIM-barrel fold metal-dependent hydrolase
VREARKLIEEYGVRGFKFHPTMQGFYPNDRMAIRCMRRSTRAALSRCSTPQTGVGSGMPGGIMRKYSNLMYMDDVAADFPDLKIILAHPLPRQEEALSVTHAERLYRPLRLVAEIFLADPALPTDPAGQDAVRPDWPVITLRLVCGFRLDIREIRPKVLKANARKILGI